MTSVHEDELFILINELVGGDPRRAFLCQRICHIAAAMVDEHTHAGRRHLIELVVDASGAPPPGPPTPEGYPL